MQVGRRRTCTPCSLAAYVAAPLKQHSQCPHVTQIRCASGQRNRRRKKMMQENYLQVLFPRAAEGIQGDVPALHAATQARKTDVAGAQARARRSSQAAARVLPHAVTGNTSAEVEKRAVTRQTARSTCPRCLSCNHSPASADPCPNTTPKRCNLRLQPVRTRLRKPVQVRHAAVSSSQFGKYDYSTPNSTPYSIYPALNLTTPHGQQVYIEGRDRGAWRAHVHVPKTGVGCSPHIQLNYSGCGTTCRR